MSTCRLIESKRQTIHNKLSSKYKNSVSRTTFWNDLFNYYNSYIFDNQLPTNIQFQIKEIRKQEQKQQSA